MEAKPHACAIRLIMRGWLPGIVSQSRGMLRCVQTAEEPGGCRVRRAHLYGHLSEADLLHAFAPFFLVNDRLELGNRRVLLLFERSGASPGSDLRSLGASPA